MTPERLADFRRWFSDSSLGTELCDEIERLQAPRPEDWEKRLGRIVEQQSEITPKYPVTKILHANVEWLTTTIRELQAKATNLEADITARDLVLALKDASVESLRAELAKERERVKVLEERDEIIEIDEDGNVHPKSAADLLKAASDKEKPCKS